MTYKTVSTRAKPSNRDRITTNGILFNRLTSGARRANVDVDQLYRECGIDPDSIGDAGYRIPVTQAVNFLHRCGYILNDEFLGLLSNPIPPGYFRHSVLAVIHQRTLGQALQRYIEFTNVFFNSLSFNLSVSGRFVEVTTQRDSNNPILDNIAIESTIATFHRLAGWLCDELIFLEQVNLDFPPPDYQREYRYLFYGAPVQFNQSKCSITFEARYMDLPVVQNEATAESYVLRAPMDIYLPQDVGGKISRLIREKLKASITTTQFAQELKDIAEEMEVTSQTIRRWLASEGTSFNAIKSQVRRDIAMNALGNHDLSIEEVAIQAGYSEPAAFIRAFKSWSGLSPSKFRKLLTSP
ncbi:MAG: AraC family transcriptional regulator [Pseudomonadota bacterium]|nr:AraC family transcriptional regulator [Pseudomonadota bacterium]